MDYKEYLDAIRRLSDKTIKVYMRIYNELKICNFDYKQLLLSKSNLSNSSIRLQVAGIKSYYIFSKDVRAKHLTMPKKDVVVKDYISFEEYKHMLSKINKNTKKGLMKRIVVRLLFETGIRSTELLWIKKQDIFENRIKIYGKGKRERYVYISKWLLKELKEYIKNVKIDKLFNFGYKNLYNKVNKVLETKKVTPHMFRRGYAKYLYSNNVSIYDISLSMGHSNIETTASYIKRNSSDVTIFDKFSQL